jgi:hypothetical protein
MNSEVKELKKDLLDVLQAYIAKCAFWGSMGCGRCSTINDCKYFSMMMKIEKELKC